MLVLEFKGIYLCSKCLSCVYSPSHTNRKYCTNGKLSVFVLHHPTVQMTKLRSPSWPVNPRPLLPHAVLSPAFHELLSLVSDHWSPWPWERALLSSRIPCDVCRPPTHLLSLQCPWAPGAVCWPLGALEAWGRSGHSLLEAHTPVIARLRVSARCCCHLPQVGHLAGRNGREGSGLGPGD